MTEEGPDPVTWECPLCGVVNPEQRYKCYRCGSGVNPAGKMSVVPVPRGDIRVVVAVCAVIGSIACFLPWVRVGIFTVSGVAGDGIVVLAAFVAAGLLVWLGRSSATAWAAVAVFVAGTWFAASIVDRFDVGVVAAGGIVAVVSGVAGVIASVGQALHLGRLERYARNAEGQEHGSA